MVVKNSSISESTTKAKKIFYKQWWFWVIIVVVLAVIGGIGNSVDDEGEIKQNAESIVVETDEEDTITQETIDNTVPTVTNDADTEASSMTVSQKNALRSAESYLKYSAFSYNGLIEQLEYEEYSHEDAVFAADNCGADWYEQAVKSAESYLKYSAFSHNGLVSQLEYEGFTHDQAEYGVTQNGL